MVAIATMSIVVAVIVAAAIAMAALVVATVLLVLVLLVFLCNGSKNLSAQDLLVTVLGIVVGWGALPVALALPISKLVSHTQSFHSSSNLGGDWGLVLPVAVNSKVLLATATKSMPLLTLPMGGPEVYFLRVFSALLGWDAAAGLIVPPAVTVATNMAPSAVGMYCFRFSPKLTLSCLPL